MNYLAAEKLARKAYCAEADCARSRVVVRMAMDTRAYTVECSRNKEHPLSVAKSQFCEYLQRWRQGERLFSLEDLIFTNSLRVMRRKDPERWDYEIGSNGAVIRIGREMWPGLKQEEKAMTQQALQRVKAAGEVYNPDQLNIIRKQIARDATDEQFLYFMAVAIRSGLDPIRKQIYPVFFRRREQKPDKSWGYADEKDMAIITGIDGYRATAAKTREAAGVDDPVYSPALLDGKYPEWCRATVYRIVQGQRVPFTATVRWEEFAYETKTDYRTNTKSRVIKPEYEERPFNMLAVRAESHAWRKGFPEEMDGLELAETRSVRVVDVETGELVDSELIELPEGTIEGTAREVPHDDTPSDSALDGEPHQATLVPENENAAEPATPQAPVASDWVAAFDGAATLEELNQHWNDVPGEVKQGKAKSDLVAAYNRNKARLTGG